MKKLLSLLAQNKRYVIFSLFFFLFALLWASKIPMTGDDWMWGSYQGENLLKDMFEGYNGRFSGNLLIIALTRSTALRVLLFASLLLFVMLTPCLLIKKKSLTLMAFSSLSLLLIPKSVMVQGLVWTSAFANYVPPVAIMMLFFIVERSAFDKEAPVHSPIRVGICSAIFLPLGFVGAMFMETATICTLFAVVLFIIACYIKHKQFFPSHIAFLCGNIVGAYLIFSNSVNESYRAFPSWENIQSILYTRIADIVSNLFGQGVFLFIVISALCLAISARYFKSKDSLVRYTALASSGANLFCLGIFITHRIEPGWSIFFGDLESSVILLAFFVLLYCVTVLLTVLICVKDKSTRLKLVLCFISAGVLIAPMLIIDPYGPRCILPTCLCICAFSVILLDYALCTCPALQSVKKIIGVGALAIFCALAVYILSIYSAIDKYADMRDEYFIKQLDAGYTEITTCYLPYNSFLWHSNVENGYWGELYQFYNARFENITYKTVYYWEFDYWAEEFDRLHPSS